MKDMCVLSRKLVASFKRNRNFENKRLIQIEMAMMINEDQFSRGHLNRFRTMAQKFSKMLNQYLCYVFNILDL